MKRVSYLKRAAVGILFVPLLLISASSDNIDSEGRTLHIGFSSLNFPKGAVKEVEVAIEALAKELSERTSARFTEASATVFDDMTTLKNKVMQKELDVLGLISLEFLEASDSIPMTPLVVAQYYQSPYFELILLTRKEDSLQNIFDLTDKKLIVDELINKQITRLWIDVLLMRNSLPEMESFFSEISGADKASQAVLKVFFGQMDACITSRKAFNTIVELNPQVGEELRILNQSQPLLVGIVCVREDMSEDDRTSIHETLEVIHNSPEGEQLLMIMKIERLVPYKAEYLQTTQELVKEYESLRVANGFDSKRIQK